MAAWDEDSVGGLMLFSLGIAIGVGLLASCAFSIRASVGIGIVTFFFFPMIVASFFDGGH